MFGTGHNAPDTPLFVEHLTLRSRLLRKESDITLVTQCSFDRLPALERQASSWHGVLCVAILWTPAHEGWQHDCISEKQKKATNVKHAATLLKTLHR
jgi:hypothetical protein